MLDSFVSFVNHLRTTLTSANFFSYQFQPPKLPNVGACQIGMVSWYTERLHFCFCIILLLFVLFSEIVVKGIFSAVHGQNQMTSCLFLPWTAQNIGYRWVFRLTLIDMLDSMGTHLNRYSLQFTRYCTNVRANHLDYL